MTKVLVPVVFFIFWIECKAIISSILWIGADAAFSSEMKYVTATSALLAPDTSMNPHAPSKNKGNELLAKN